MRSLFAGLAAIWFAYNALMFIPIWGTVYSNEGAPGGLDGEPASVAVTWAARTLFVGLTFVSLSLVHWSAVKHQLQTFGN